MNHTTQTIENLEKLFVVKVKEHKLYEASVLSRKIEYLRGLLWL